MSPMGIEPVYRGEFFHPQSLKQLSASGLFNEKLLLIPSAIRRRLVARMSHRVDVGWLMVGNPPVDAGWRDGRRSFIHRQLVSNATRGRCRVG